MVRKGKGRQKIEMVKINKETNLQVTFSKRRFGLFKKASELCTLCGVQIMMIVFSPGGKAYSFGHPNVKDLIYRFLNHNHYSLLLHQHNINLQIAETRPEENVEYLNMILTEELAKHENEKKKRMDLDKIRKSREKKGNWYEKDVKELDLNQTNYLISALQDVKNKLVSEISEYYKINGSRNYFGESSSTITPGRNVDVGHVPFDQRRMFDDPNAFNFDPNMNFSNYRPTFGYYNNGVIVPRSNMNSMPSYNFNQS